MTRIPISIEEKLVELVFQIYKFFYKIGLKFLDDLGKNQAKLLFF